MWLAFYKFMLRLKVSTASLSEATVGQVQELREEEVKSDDESLPGDQDSGGEILSDTSEEHDAAEVSGPVGVGRFVQPEASRTVHIGGALVLLLCSKAHEVFAGACTLGISFAREGGVSLLNALQSAHASLTLTEKRSLAANFRCQAATMSFSMGFRYGALILGVMRWTGCLHGWKATELKKRGKRTFRVMSFNASRQMPRENEVTEFALKHWPSCSVQVDAMAWAEQRFAIGKVPPDWGRPGRARSERDDNAHHKALKSVLRSKRTALQLGHMVCHRRPDETVEAFSTRLLIVQKEREGEKRRREKMKKENVRLHTHSYAPSHPPPPPRPYIHTYTIFGFPLSQDRALALATEAGRLEVGATFELWKNDQWERLRVTHVGSIISARTGMGEVPMYSLESISHVGKTYACYDFSSFPGAEGAYRVRAVSAPPPPPPTLGERVAAAKAAKHQTRAIARLQLGGLPFV